MQTRIALNRSMHHGCLLVLVWLACAWLPLNAATPPAPATADPPARVARVAWLAGDVSLLPAGGDQWQAVELNRPLTRGAVLATAAGARVELQLGGAMAHLAGDSEFSLLALGQWQTQFALTRGSAELNVGTLPDGEYVEIDTPQVAIVIDRSARVRVDLGAGDATTVTVRRGSVVVHGERGVQQVLHAGDRYRFASPVLADAMALTLGSGDAFDHWTRARELLYADSRSNQYVAAGTVGYQGLDHYGQWRSEPDYGEVWFPNGVAAGWVPYRNGRWVWIAPWGMTWVSNEPWGFAPFHYGRWAVIGGRWGWLPGRVAARAVYAPALVGFFGGSGWNVSVGLAVGRGGLVGWYPLGPGMIYNPWYPVNWGYYSRINRWHGYAHHRHQHHEQRVREAYNAWREPKRLRHMRFVGQPPHGITIVARKTLAGGHDVRRAQLHLAASHVRKAPLRYRGLDVKPAHVRGATWHPKDAAGGANKPVVAVHRPRAPVAVLHHEQAKMTPRRSVPVRLLDSNARPWERPVHRPLPSRLVDNPPPRRAAPTPTRGTGGGVAHVTKRPAAPVVRTRTHNPKLARTLPRVPRLQLSTREPRAGGTLSVLDAPVRETSSVRAPTRHDNVVAPVAPRVRHPRPTAERDAGTPDWRRTAVPRTAPARPANPVRRLMPVRPPSPVRRSIPVRPTGTVRRSTPVRPPSPVRRSAPVRTTSPVRWHPAPAAPQRRAAPSRAPSRAAARRVTPTKHSSKSHDQPPPVRWSGKSH